MSASAIPATPDDLLPWRDRYRLEMRCQIVHDSIHRRPGWTNEYWLRLNEADTQAPTVVGYGSVAVGGPWSGIPTAYEFFVAPEYRSRVFDLFQALLDASGAGVIEVQSNDPLASVMLHAFADDVTTQSILFHDTLTTTHPSGGATLRQVTADEAPDVSDDNRRWYHVLVVGGETAATGGILFHYNRPYGDIFMEVAEPFRRRGLGTYLVQELKRVCCEGGFVPAARCNPQNVASRRTLQKAGFVPCGHILHGSVPQRRGA